MTNIIELAKAAGGVHSGTAFISGSYPRTLIGFGPDALERFEALIRADEREQIIELPQIKGNLFAEKAIRARKP